MNKLLAVVLMVALASGLALAGCSEPAPAQSIQVGDVAPDFQLPGLDGKSVSLEYSRGRPVLLNFWATWCPPCRIEMPHIQAIFDDQEWSDRGLVILAIDIGESRDTVRSFMESFGYTFPVLLDGSKDVAIGYNVRGIPTTFFNDGDGVIQARKIGPFSSKEDIEKGLSQIVP